MFNQLNERERIFVFGGALLIIGMLVYLIVNGLYSLRKELSDAVGESVSQATQLDMIVNDYNFYRSLETGGQDEDVSQMYSKLDQILIRYGLKEKVLTMKDNQSSVLKEYLQINIEVSFRSVLLNDVIKLIYDIEKNKQINAKVESFNFRKPFQDKDYYDVNLKISSYKKVGKGG
jgi:general secretion pathway protein M